MARKRASMREGPLAELFKATEAAQRQTDEAPAAPEHRGAAPQVTEETVEHPPPTRHLGWPWRAGSRSRRCGA